MKKLLKILLIISLSGIALFLLAIAGGVIYLETSIDRIMTEERQEELFMAINSSPELPELFYSTMEKYDPEFFERTAWPTFFSGKNWIKNSDCRCGDMYFRPSEVDKPIRFYAQILVLELEEECGHRKCFDYYLQTAHFGMHNKGIETAAKTYYSKELTQLNEREIVELWVMLKAPNYYNPVLNPENLKKAADRFMYRNE